MIPLPIQIREQPQVKALNRQASVSFQIMCARRFMRAKENHELCSSLGSGRGSGAWKVRYRNVLKPRTVMQPAAMKGRTLWYTQSNIESWRLFSATKPTPVDHAKLPKKLRAPQLSLNRSPCDMLKKIQNSDNEQVWL
jgi:hypothetical protein